MITFTKEHEAKLDAMLATAIKKNRIYQYGVGQIINVVELLHTVSINTLVKMLSSLKKQIAAEEDKDEWNDTVVNTEKLDQLREDRDLINYIIGYKRKNLEIAANAKKKAELTAKLAELKESTKTPEDRIKEMEAALAKLDEF